MGVVRPRLQKARGRDKRPKRSQINGMLHSLCFAGKTKKSVMCSHCLSDNHSSERCSEAPRAPSTGEGLARERWGIVEAADWHRHPKPPEGHAPHQQAKLELSICYNLQEPWSIPMPKLSLIERGIYTSSRVRSAHVSLSAQ